jgi:hypothetical protein
MGESRVFCRITADCTTLASAFASDWFAASPGGSSPGTFIMEWLPSVRFISTV